MPIKKIITGQLPTRQLVENAEAMRQTMTQAEAKLWQRLKANRLGGLHFRRQQVIGQYIVDFYCHQAELVVEVDGGVHIGREEIDQIREQRLQSFGLKVLRFTNIEIDQHMDVVLDMILRTCKETILGG